VSLFHQLLEKPWVTPEGASGKLPGGHTFALPTATLGLRVFLAVATVLFSLSIVGYADRMTLGDWRPLPEPWLLWANTAMLVLCSVAFQWAVASARREEPEGVRLGLLAGGVFTFAFLVGQVLASQRMIALGYYAETNPANAFFYFLTGLHAAHLLGGLVAWARTSAKVRRGLEVERVRLSVELCAVYWHFLLVVWLVLFGLLLLT
jgi:cytochrome c oxidase subunit 3